MTDYKAKIYEAVKNVLPIDRDDVTVSDKFCDYCVPCFKLAKTMRRAPAAIASEGAAVVKLDGMTVEAVGGYINFTIERAARINDLFASALGAYKPFDGKTVCIDYSSVNIAKPFHIGHLMTTVIGGSLYKIYRALGANAVGINHLGDFGTQFGGLIVAYERWGSEADLEKRGLDALLELYVRFNKEAEAHPELKDEARSRSGKIESGDPYAVGLFEKFKAITLEQAKKVYKRLNIEFDSYLGESFYVDKVSAVEDKLRAKNLLETSDGAEVVDLKWSEVSGETEPKADDDKTDETKVPAIIRRSDGASLYIARDLAAAYYRHDTYNFDKCLYVVASHQALHFKQLFRILELLGEPWASDMVHVSYGMVSVEGMALSTRHGNVLYLSDVLDAAVDKAKEIIEERNPALYGKAAVAESVGVGAVVFDALYDGKLKDKNFSIADALNFDGETGPYVQYTHARCRSVLAKAGETSARVDLGTLLADDAAYDVVKLLSDFDDVVYTAAVKYEPSVVSRRLVKICQAFNRFYNADRIMCGGDMQAARLALTERVADTLEYGLGLVLLAAPNRM